MLIKAADKDPIDELYVVATFINEFLEEPNEEEDTLELGTWLCELLRLYGDNYRS